MAREAAVWRALGDDTRRAIFERLTRGEAPVKTLTKKLAVSQPAVSQHLAALEKAGLVRKRKQGRLVYYRVEPAGLAPLVDWLTHYQSFWLERLDALKSLLKEIE
jgi:DNA-binding transcriptional ArsR family regulator